MNLQSFRIQNFRSIRDTGWKSLADDGITCLIGQNEAGKSSILEALYSFSFGRIENEVLRSDGTLPEVSCCYSLSDKDIETIYDKVVGIPTSLVNELNNKKIVVTRKWAKPTASKLLLDEVLLNTFPNPKPQQAPKSKEPTDEPETEQRQVATEVQVTKETSRQEFEEIIFNLLPAFVRFENYTSLLPNSIDIDDLDNENDEVEGYAGVQNLLKITELDIYTLVEQDDRFADSTTEQISKKLTIEFREFWKQRVGNNNQISIEINLKHHKEGNPETAGKPYLVFWINDGKERLHPKQRSSGVRWFTSFYLQLKATSKINSNVIYLIDEPGGNLHARAQEDVLRVFEDIKHKVQIIYTTHSPFLLDQNTAYRLLAVQRKDTTDEKSETLVFSHHELASASVDTLTPLFTLIGADLSTQQVIRKKNNILLEEISAMYYLLSFWHLFQVQDVVSFLPATGASNVPLFVNLFLGWGLKFIVALDDDQRGRTTYNQILRTVYFNDKELADKEMFKIKNSAGIEDIFSKSFFKQHILLIEQDYPDSNSQHVKDLSKGVLAMKFWIKVKDGQIKASDLDKETKNAAEALVKEIQSRLLQEKSQ